MPGIEMIEDQLYFLFQGKLNLLEFSFVIELFERYLAITTELEMLQSCISLLNFSIF